MRAQTLTNSCSRLWIKKDYPPEQAVYEFYIICTVEYSNSNPCRSSWFAMCVHMVGYLSVLLPLLQSFEPELWYIFVFIIIYVYVQVLPWTHLTRQWTTRLSANPLELPSPSSRWSSQRSPIWPSGSLNFALVLFCSWILYDLLLSYYFDTEAEPVWCLNYFVEPEPYSSW